MTGIDNTTLMLALGGGGLMFILLLFYGLGGDHQMSKRLTRVGSGEPPKTKIVKTTSISAIRTQTKKSFLDRLAENLPNIQKLKDKIARTGKPISIQKYCVWMVLSAIAGFVLFKFILL